MAIKSLYSQYIGQTLLCAAKPPPYAASHRFLQPRYLIGSDGRLSPIPAEERDIFVPQMLLDQYPARLLYTVKLIDKLNPSSDGLCANVGMRDENIIVGTYQLERHYLCLPYEGSIQKLRAAKYSIPIPTKQRDILEHVSCGVMLRCADARFYGPFSASVKGDTMELEAMAEQHHLIGKFSAPQLLNVEEHTLIAADSIQFSNCLPDDLIDDFRRLEQEKYVSALIKRTLDTHAGLKLSRNQRTALVTAMKEAHKELRGDSEPSISKLLEKMEFSNELLDAMGQHICTDDELARQLVRTVLTKAPDKVKDILTANESLKNLVGKPQDVEKLRQDLNAAKTAREKAEQEKKTAEKNAREFKKERDKFETAKSALEEERKALKAAKEKSDREQETAKKELEKSKKKLEDTLKELKEADVPKLKRDLTKAQTELEKARAGSEQLKKELEAARSKSGSTKGKASASGSAYTDADKHAGNTSLLQVLDTSRPNRKVELDLYKRECFQLRWENEQLKTQLEELKTQPSTSATAAPKRPLKGKALTEHKDKEQKELEKIQQEKEREHRALSVLLQQSKDTQSKLDALQPQLEAAQTTIAEGEAAEKARDAAEQQCREFSLRMEGMRQELKGIVAEYREGATKCANMLFDQSLMAEFSGRQLAEASDAAEHEQEPANALQLSPYNAKAKQLTIGNALIDRVAAFMEQAGRKLNRAELTNYLICLTQGFITTFAGKPGSGKTSLCNLLAKSLGLATDAANTRFVDVSVGRGWSSYKDLIGYYNPLSDKMVKSNAAVYDALQQVSAEAVGGEHAPMLILLDEANLSPMEHYWSLFLKNSDMDGIRTRRFSLGGETECIIPNHLRFLATVNFDHTTEELSPRFLDRSWIIVQDAPDNDLAPEIELVPNAEAATSYAELNAAFNNAGALSMPAKLDSMWSNIRAVMKKHERPIMPRCNKMVTDYVKVASLFTKASALSPLDYAVAQKVLPSLNGTGDKFGQFLEELEKACAGLEKSCAILRRMQNKGKDNLYVYNFFAQ